MKQQQRGGTFLGLILGLVVGLAVALGVAMYITKMPTPLSNKNVPRSSEQDAAESEKNKAWNPNGALQSKPVAPAPGAVEPAAPSEAAPAPATVPAAPPGGSPAAAPHADVKPAAPAVPPPAPVPTPAPKPVAVPTKPTESKEAKEAKETKAAKETQDSKPAVKESKPASSADPLGDLVKSRAAQVASKDSGAAAGADAFAYVVQVGAYRQESDAQAQKAKMALMGLDARISERDLSGGKVYRVRLGPFNDKDSAERVRAKLQAAQVEGTLVRIER